MRLINRTTSDMHIQIYNNYTDPGFATILYEFDLFQGEPVDITMQESPPAAGLQAIFTLYIWHSPQPPPTSPHQLSFAVTSGATVTFSTDIQFGLDLGS